MQISVQNIKQHFLHTLFLYTRPKSDIFDSNITAILLGIKTSSETLFVEDIDFETKCSKTTIN